MNEGVLYRRIARCKVSIIVPTKCLLALTLILLVPSSFANDQPEYEIQTFSVDGIDYEVVQLARYVLESTQFPGTQHFASILRGTPQYGDEYHHPNQPAGPIPVNCENTRMLAVGFMMKREEKLRNKRKRFDIRYVWSHSSVESFDKNLDRNDVLWFRKSRTRIYPKVHLEIPDELKVDGVISLQASIGRDVILYNSFELLDCPKKRE